MSLKAPRVLQYMEGIDEFLTLTNVKRLYIRKTRRVMRNYDERRDFIAPLFTAKANGFWYDVYLSEHLPGKSEFNAVKEFVEDCRLQEAGLIDYFRVEKTKFNIETRIDEVIETCDPIRAKNVEEAVEKAIEYFNDEEIQ